MQGFEIEKHSCAEYQDGDKIVSQVVGLLEVLHMTSKEERTSRPEVICTSEIGGWIEGTLAQYGSIGTWEEFEQRWFVCGMIGK